VDEYLADSLALVDEQSFLEEEFLDALPSGQAPSTGREAIEAEERAQMRSMCSTFRANPFTFQLSEGVVSRQQETGTAVPHSEPPLLYNFWLDESQPSVQEVPPRSWRTKSPPKSPLSISVIPLKQPRYPSESVIAYEEPEFNPRYRRMLIDPRRTKHPGENSPPDFQPDISVSESAYQILQPDPLPHSSLPSLSPPPYNNFIAHDGAPTLEYPERPTANALSNQGQCWTWALYSLTT